MEDITIGKVSEFVDFITENMSRGFNLFRGQSKLSYPVLPSLLRVNPMTQKRRYGDRCDTSFLNAFKSRSIPYMKNTPVDDIEWMFTAQHFGLPTRLLDWSFSPLTALYFAVEKYNVTFEEEDCPVVWMLNPVNLNAQGGFLGKRSDLPNIIENNDTLTACIKQHYSVGVMNSQASYPLALTGPLNNERINAQNGAFTLFALNSEPLETMTNVEDFLMQIKINKDNIYNIKKELYNLGIKHSTVYPELPSIALDIVFEYEYEYE